MLAFRTCGTFGASKGQKWLHCLSLSPFQMVYGASSWVTSLHFIWCKECIIKRLFSPLAPLPGEATWVTASYFIRVRNTLRHVSFRLLHFFKIITSFSNYGYFSALYCYYYYYYHYYCYYYYYYYCYYYLVTLP